MNQPEVVFFDCDHTVIDTDCEWTWINMLADMGRVPGHYRAKQNHYINLHAKGLTPEREYLAFILQEFVGQTPDSMQQLAQSNFDDYIRDKVFSGAREEINKHQNQQIPVVLLSGSTRVMVTPIAAAMGFDDIACTELELVDGHYSGDIVGPFCIREGKLKRALDYCEQHQMNFRNAMYYGDSISDLQIFEKIGFPVAVNPNPKLTEIAIQKHWAIENW
jgi:HAD superfamily hydrolase (TIGR01490 family)